jgi:hypothetical protein
MGLGALGHLAADAHDRIQGGHRLLEDHGDLLTAQAAKRTGRLAQEIDFSIISTFPQDLPLDLRCRTEQAENRQGRGAFARAGLADKAQNLAFVQMEVDAAHRFRGAETNVQVVDIEERRHDAIL